MVCILLARVPHFNSQPHKEADVYGKHDDWADPHFNSQPHKEADVMAEDV